MTEQEARTKWCPMARVSTYSVGNPAESAANRTDEGTPYPASRCIASDCMMWEPEEKEPRETMRHRKGKLYDAVAGSIRVVNGEPWRYEYSDVDDKGEYDLLHRALSEKQSVKCGHCGIGGKP